MCIINKYEIKDLIIINIIINLDFSTKCSAIKKNILKYMIVLML